MITRSVFKRSHVSLALTFILGVCLSLLAAISIQDWEHERINTEFRESAQERITALQRGLEHYLNEIRAIGSLYKASRNVDREEFRAFVQEGLSRNPGIRALEWVPRVVNEQRVEFEAAMRQDFPSFQITERKAHGEMVVAAIRDEYFPVSFIEPYTGNEAALGFDLGSNSGRLETLLRARDTGELLATGQVNLVQDGGEQAGVLLSLPVYRNNVPTHTLAQRHEHLLGFVLGVFRVSDLVKASLAHFDRQSIELTIHDQSGSRATPLATFRDLDLNGNPTHNRGTRLVEKELSVVLKVAGRQWSVYCSPAPGYFQSAVSWRSWLVLLTGILFSGLLTAYLALAQDRTTRVARKVRERTAELRASKSSLEREIAERERTGTELAESEGRLRAIWETAVDAIITADGMAIIQSFNPAAERIFGYQAGEVIGKNLRVLMPAPYREQHDGYIAAYQHTHKPKVIGTGREVTGLRKDGSTFPMDLAVSETRLEGRSMFTGIVRDITERKKIECMKNEFISTVSHELRTPLTSIRGALGLVASGTAGELPEKAQPLVEIAAKNCDRLVRLINDILDIEKIEANKMDFNTKPCELMPLVHQAVEANLAYAEGHGARIVVAEELVDEFVFADEDRFIQVLTNLLSNAAKYTPEGGAITVTAKHHEGGVRLSVRDEGPGIPEEFRARIFEKFSQADASDTRQKGGSGLGLSISRAIVEKLGGQISFETELDKGTTFYVDLPLWQVQASHADTAPGALTSADAMAEKILVCEDDPDIAHLLKLMLQTHGYAAEVARNAAEAKAMLASNHYAAMTLDLMLPDQNGLDLFRELRQDEKTSRLPVIVVSAIADRGKQELNGDAVCVVDWLDKPINEDRLVAAVASSVLQSQAGRVRILHVEDEPDVRSIVSALLTEAGRITPAGSLKEARQCLASEDFDLVILDLGLPDGSGMSLLHELSQRSPQIPVMLFSAQEVGTHLTHGVAATLVKSKTSNEMLMNTIHATIAKQTKVAEEA